MGKAILYISIIVSAASAFLAGLPLLVNILLASMVADTISGLLRAIYEKKFSVVEVRKEASQKVGILLMVILANHLQQISNVPIEAGGIVAAFYIYGELSSFLSNITRLGLPVPKQLSSIVAVVVDEETKTKTTATIVTEAKIEK